MRNIAASALVIARRDFVVTVFTKTFLLFLLGPLLIIGISILFGNLGERMAQQDLKPTVAVIASEADFAAIATIKKRVEPAFGERGMAELVRYEPDYVIDAQARDLLGARDKRILAVLTGGIDRPRLIGAVSDTGSIRGQLTLLIEEARHQRALAGAGVRSALPAEIEFVKVEESAGSIASARALTARSGQLLIFMLTVLLAGMLLSNLVEEKTNKVIEVLAAALPVDAIFLGKLIAMLGVSVVGIAVWASAAAAGMALWSPGSMNMPEPAVGGPLFVLLVTLYFAANYLILGALFLGIGSQASSVREVQTLSMPVTLGQVLVFLLASFAVGPYNSLLGIGAAVFPLSSPLAMVARAAQTPELWPHLLALLWQALWVWLVVKLSASLFRSNVLKSGSGGSAMPWRRRSTEG
ncbi:MAG TPA: ABC transporter permease [Allosphingosinicella sp.]|uniref:ABC transporter permease n=1 Tax=Allosphingosinicella sp. TaxID=2823234 RepID=UPI002ED8E359